MRNKNKEVARNCVFGMLHRKTQSVIVITSLLFIDSKEEKAKVIVTEVLQKFGSKYKFLEFTNSIRFIQKRIKKQMSLKYSKVDVLINFWDKILGSIIKDKIKFKDKKADSLAIELTKIQKPIRDACLRCWIDRCKAVYNIAFMQWRLLYPTTCEYFNEEELKDIIMSRINMQKKITVFDQRVSPETEALSEISTDFLIKFGYADDANKLFPSSINSFV